MRYAWIAIIASSTACLPSFEEVECYADIDCPGEFVCSADHRCISIAPMRDAGSTPRDGGVTPRDGGDDERDGGLPIDGGMPTDAGTRDAGNRDGGFADGGFDIRFVPATVDFGVRPIGCPASVESVSLENNGSSPVRIERIGLATGTSAEYSVTAPATPFDLLTTQPRLIDIAYAPADTTADPGMVEVTFADGDDLTTLTLSGNGAVAPQLMDSFTAEAGPIDVLFVIDTSASMTLLQERLSDSVVFLLLSLEVEDWDYRIAVTTMDTSGTGARGAFLGTPTVLTQQLANRQTLLENRIVAGTTGPPQRRAFDAVELALSAPLITGANAGFLRTDAPLLLIYFSAIDDESTATVASHAAFLNALKTGTMQPVVTNVITPTIFACTLEGGITGMNGQRFQDLAGTTMGAIDNMCGSNWTDAISTLPPPTPPLAYPLSAVPSVPTIEVSVQGVAVPSNAGANWSYDAASQSVVFSPAARPTLGDAIVVTYLASC